MLALRAHKSNTVRSQGGSPGLPGFGISIIGTVFPLLVTFQRPLFMYASHFSAHWALIASGHRDGCQGYILLGSIKLISWLMTRNGSSGVSLADLQIGAAYLHNSSQISSKFS